jgi:hypothetical protein
LICGWGSCDVDRKNGEAIVTIIVRYSVVEKRETKKSLHEYIFTIAPLAQCSTTITANENDPNIPFDIYSKIDINVCPHSIGMNTHRSWFQIFMGTSKCQ